MPKGIVPPFFGNTKDNLHCFQASMKMILKHFEPKKTYGWKKLDEFSGQKKGKWTWPIDMIINLEKLGYETHVIDNFDHKEFIKKGEIYFYDIWTKDVADAQIKHSDIPHVIRSYTKLPPDFDYKKRDATLGDIRNFLKKGYLVETGVNSAALNKRKSYAGHSVVIYRADKTHLYLHDSGLPPQPSRKVTIELFKKAWTSRSVLAIRKT